MACQLLQNMTSGHINVKKGTGHVFYMATPSHATESVAIGTDSNKILIMDVFNAMSQWLCHSWVYQI